MKKYIAAILLFVAWPSFAADINGYTAQYECRAGGPNCNVDVATLTAQACQQTITTSTTPTNDWSAINFTNQVICIQAGDHTARGRLFISASGTAGTRKVLRYTRASDNDDEPWNQSTANKAKLKGLELTGADYWIIHRLTFDGDGTSAHSGINFANSSGATNNIVNRVLVEDYNASLIIIGHSGNDNNVIQKSVLRDTRVAASTTIENQCIALRGGSANKWVVNNEMYNCTKITFAEEGTNPHPGLVIENNDAYTTTSRYTDCAGTYTTNGPCADTEGVAFDSKSGSSTSNIGRIIHNRVWGFRAGDGNFAQAGGGWAVSFSNVTDDFPGSGTDYTLVQNNIIWDMNLAFWNFYKGPDHNSIIGNLIFDVYDHGGNPPFSRDIGGISTKSLDTTEVYLNTFINVDPIIDDWGNDTSKDILCNVFVGGGAASGSYGSGTEVDRNAFYGVKMTTTGTTGSNVVYPNISDANMTEYCFNKRLRTGPERVCIPNARPTNSSPHLNACDASLGARRGVGVSDEFPVF